MCISQGSSAESEEKAASLLFSRITPARVDEHVPIHYVRLILSIYKNKGHLGSVNIEIL